MLSHLILTLELSPFFHEETDVQKFKTWQKAQQYYEAIFKLRSA